MPVLALREVSLSFARGRRHVVQVLANVSLEVAAAEVVSVLAQRAQGKTTLLRVAAGMVRPDRGMVCFDGEDVWSLSDSRRSRLLAEEIGFVAVAPPELDAPVLENIALPLIRSRGRREAYLCARDALARVGVAECAAQSWEDLSDWERALVAIARGVVREPKLLLVDDLTASVGLVEADELTRMLAALANERGFGVLLCVSDADATGWSARIGTLAAGELLLAAPAAAHGTVIDLPLNAAGRVAKRR